MKSLFVILLVSAILLFGCIGTQSPPQVPPAGGGTPSGGQTTPSDGGAPRTGGGQLGASGGEPQAGNAGEPSGDVSSGQPVPGSDVPDTEVVRDFTIEATNWEFSPSEITVNKGEKVRITLTNVEGVHGIAIPGFGVDLKCGMGESKSVEFTADKEGTFEFRCNVMCGEGHRSMKGTLTVK